MRAGRSTEAWPLLGALTAMLGGCGASAAQPLRPSVTLPHVISADSSETAPGEAVFGPEHDRVRESLADAGIAKVRLGGGGRSVKFKLTLEDGTVGLYKPEQTFAAYWFSEVAAYYVDRALGLGRVPPTTGRRISWSRLRRAGSESRHVDEVVVRNRSVRGSFTWWVPTKLEKVELPLGWEAWLSIDEPAVISPFQRRSNYRRAIDDPDRHQPAPAPPPPVFPDRPAELSDLILFDYLIGNKDRWGGGFTNVRTLGPGGPMVFIDNANGFHRGKQTDAQSRAQLAAVQRMRGSTAEALLAFDVDQLRRSLSEDPLAPVLAEHHFEGLERRLGEIQAHIEAMRREHGEEATPW